MAEARRHHSRSYQCIKKTGYLRKSPTSGKMGRWRKRWIMLVDSLVPVPGHGSCERYARMEYYEVPGDTNKKIRTRNLSVLKLKGVIDLRFCIAVQPSGNDKSKKFHFDIITGSSPVHHFAAGSQRERDDWIKALNNFLFSKKARTNACACHHSPISRVLSSSSHSDSGSDYIYDHLQPYRTLDDDYVRAARDPSVNSKKTSRESLRRFLSANDISYKQANTECLPLIESPAQDISSLQQQLAFLYAPEIQPDTIVDPEVIGSGYFSMVSRGVWATPSGSYSVAVKHASGNNATLRLLQEAVVMVQLWHPNVVNLLGLIQPDKPITLVTELCTQGNLLCRLKAIRSKTVSIDTELVPTLLKYCEHILLGLNYLTDKGFIHRALMAKHVLITGENVCKLSGFACSEILSSEKECIVQSDAYVPVKWTAPEATMYFKFTPASMVWGFGVMLYEIWSLGQEPYQLMAIPQITDWLLGGNRLSPPPGCSRHIYEVMIACWHPDPAMRPETSTILKYLLQLDSTALVPPTAEAPTPALELGGELSAGHHLHKDLQESYLLYVNTAGNKAAGNYVNVNPKTSPMSNKVDFNTRWSFNDDGMDDGSDEDSSLEEQPDQKHKHIYQNDQFHSTTNTPAKPNSSKVYPHSLATNLDGRWSLSSRASYDELDDWIKEGPPQVQQKNPQPLSLMLSDNEKDSGDSSDATFVDADDLSPLMAKRFDSDDDSLSPINMPLLPRGTTAATGLGAGWSKHDDEESDGEDYFNFSHKYLKHESRNSNRGKLDLGVLLNRRSSETITSSPFATQVPSSEKSKTISPRGPKPPIKPRKKLLQSSSAVASPSEQAATMITSSSEPVLHVPKAAPRKPLLRAVSVQSYEQINSYETIGDIDQGHLEKIVWAAQNHGSVPEHSYYNLSSPSIHQEESSSHTYDKIQRYEKIQTYETIPYHLDLDHIGIPNNAHMYTELA